MEGICTPGARTRRNRPADAPGVIGPACARAPPAPRAAPVVAAAREAPAQHHTKKNATPARHTHSLPAPPADKMSIIIDDAGVNGADGKNVYVGNLSWETDDAQLLELVELLDRVGRVRLGRVRD